jgi:hypothetical protein
VRIRQEEKLLFVLLSLVLDNHLVSEAFHPLGYPFKAALVLLGLLFNVFLRFQTSLFAHRRTLGTERGDHSKSARFVLKRVVDITGWRFLLVCVPDVVSLEPNS